MHVPVLAHREDEVPSWWADAGSSGGWLAAHGSQLIDQIRATLGEFSGVSASLTHVIDRPMSADDGFVVHFRMASGCVGSLQSTASDHGIVVETRVTGSAATAWIEGVGATVKLAAATGVRTLPPVETMPTVRAPALPEGVVTTAYERMTTFGVEYGPYVRLAGAFRDLILGRTVPDPPPATFADGVAMMTVLDAIRRSAAAGGVWTEVDGTEIA
jgi:predicted dehydrogenase